MTIPETLTEKLSHVSTSPGVYLMKEKGAGIIYVGKASNLKKRLASYFTRIKQQDIKTRALVAKIETFDTIVTKTEKEALILESSLIRKHKPRYNIDLKDDKRYPFIRINIKEEFPTLSIVRKIGNDGALYFGPNSSSGAVRQTIKLIHRTFKLRKCKTKEKSLRNRSRPCLSFQMGDCLGPCCYDVSTVDYNGIVKEVILFLKGRTPELISSIKNDMLNAAENLEFERASQMRDKMFALKKTLEKQVAVTTDFADRDVAGIFSSPMGCFITVLHVQNGFMLGARDFNFSNTLAPDREVMSSFLRQYYKLPRTIPKEILVSVNLEDKVLVEDTLRLESGHGLRIMHPQRGDKAALMEIAVGNAKKALEEFAESDQAATELMNRLMRKLNMTTPPKRIECIDNSNISGSNPVSGIVVFEDGKPKKSDYRTYKIRNTQKGDDYAYMAEAMKRRFGKGDDSLPLPDLLMVDGGKGQLNIALANLKALNLEDKFSVIGIAKKDEKKGETADKVFQPNRANPVIFGRDEGLLLFLMQVRDEAHRFAITFHKKQRTKSTIKSALDTVPGIGEKRKFALLRHFKSIKKIREADQEELLKVPGMNSKAADNIKKYLGES